MTQALNILAVSALIWGGLFAAAPGMTGHDRRPHAVPVRVKPRRR